jgi:hypothetical protein
MLVRWIHRRNDPVFHKKAMKIKTVGVVIDALINMLLTSASMGSEVKVEKKSQKLDSPRIGYYFYKRGVIILGLACSFRHGVGEDVF